MNFDHVQAGNVLNFTGHHPVGIISPGQDMNAFQESRQWPGHMDLGNVTVTAHPDIARQVGMGPTLKTMSKHVGSRFSKFKFNYRMPDWLAPPRNQHKGSFNAHFVGYTDGTTRFIQSDSVVISKDFTGCLMVVYKVNGQRRVAHAPAASLTNMDCKQAFLTEIANTDTHELIGYFRPFDRSRDHFMDEFKRMYFNEEKRVAVFDNPNDPDDGRWVYVSAGLDFMKAFDPMDKQYTVMGLVDTNNRCYSIQGFQPDGYPNYFLITRIEKHRLRHGHVFDKAPTVA